MSFNDIAWLPLCIGVTAVGLVFSFLAFRRRGAAAGMRMTAWALLPAAAYLTGALQALWTIGSTAVGFVTSLILSPAVWAGVALAGLSAVLFVVSGVVRGRKLAKAGEGGKTGGKRTAAPEAAPGAQQAPAAAQAPGRPAVSAGKERKSDDDFSDIEDILKRRGIS
ncbi:cellulose synthase [Nonomuraea sp. NPDC005983]|uniref:cellulose synthase n=1 Tax=Nonomuraea sp. NPDC005983 TaxID=3155595 RepID=UPI0033B42453